ncbi:hypothetical protein HF526_04090 [Pseudonocardia sp. K10HN5]|uniref:DDE family transposase n=1 Tax=Pseudonocardia acidicola TaxID=2724939 RepID=A0ABX1S4K2_9PSEU|nr:hypothetical protein [Pseudonocardia acidicola]
MRVRGHLLAAAAPVAARRVWQELHRVVLDRLAHRDLLDWSRAAVDSVSVRAKRRGKYHVLCDRNRLPLHALVTGASTHDSGMLAPLLNTNPGVHGLALGLERPLRGHCAFPVTRSPRPPRDRPCARPRGAFGLMEARLLLSDSAEGGQAGGGRVLEVLDA